MKILIAEDDPVSRHMLEALLLKWDYEVDTSADGTQAWEVLQGDDAPRLAILDWMMPGMDGLEVCRSVRKRGGEPYVYTLLLTARDQMKDVIEGLEAGADDYLTKPFDQNELRARLRAGRRILALQESLISARDALRFQGTRDPLTMLWNRAATLDTLRREISRGERQGVCVGIILADLDGFQRVNETYGHMAGDAVLRETARRLRSSVRLHDTIGRFGGEEFLVLAPDCESSTALKLAERLRASISGEAMDLSEGKIRMTLSAGVTTSAPEKKMDAASIIRAADAALSRAKIQGRNRVELASPGEVIETLSPETTKPLTRLRGQEASR